MLLLLRLTHLTRLVSLWLLLLLFLLGNDISSVREIISIICEMIILLSINDGLDQPSCFLSFLLKDCHNDVHNFWNKRGETGENLLYDTLCHLLKHEVDILEQVECGFSEFLKLRLNQVDEDIH